jgi:NAD(P)H-hydrate repair Nnr-like enzyme with NAD(P)H-hydrate dehydratase domain
MSTSYWQKQTKAQPLFPDMLWSRPENRLHAGKLLIVGGNGYEFKAPANAYGDALEAGIGVAKVLLPNSMQKLMKDVFPEAEFAPSTPSGSLARAALAPMLDLAAWADGVLLGGNFGRNSETAIVLEEFLRKYQGPVTLTHDAVDYFLARPLPLLDRPQTTLVANFAGLQKLAAGAGFTSAFTSSMDVMRFVETFHDFSRVHPSSIIVKFGPNIFVAQNGHITSTNQGKDKTTWRVETAATAAVWWLQNPNNTFKALTTSLIA